MEEKKASPNLVFKLPSKENKAAEEVKVQREIVQSFGSSSPHPIPIVSDESMEKLQNGSVKESRSPRFCFKLRLKIWNDQEKQPRIEKVSQETNNDQEQKQRMEKVSNGTRDDQQEEKIIEKTGNQDEKRKKMDDLNQELSKKKRKRGFSLALSKEQIEEDIVELLGPNYKKASRKRAKKKGNRASEHQLNHLLPAAWMETLIN